MNRFACLLLILFIAQAAGAGGDTPSVVLQKIGPARILANVPREDGLVLVEFSGVFELTVEVDGDRGLEVEPPTSWIDSPTWKVKNVERPTLTKHGDGRRWRQTFVLDPIAPAVDPLELKPLHYRNADGRWHTIDTWKPIAVKIIVQVPSMDLKKLREHPTVEDVPPPAADRTWTWPVVAAVVGGISLIVILVWMLRRRAARSGRSRTAAEAALYELARLDALALPNKGRAGEYHTLLANVVRRYLEKRYQLPARRLTTQEFSSLLDGMTLLTAEQKDFLRTFLQRCDLVKFAEVQVSAQECQELGRQTREFLTAAR